MIALKDLLFLKFIAKSLFQLVFVIMLPTNTNINLTNTSNIKLNYAEAY
jgi:hypothetical protein